MMGTEGNGKNRRKRVNRLKKMILGSVFLAILIPVVICVILTLRIMGLKGQLKQTMAERDALTQEILNRDLTMADEAPLEELPDDSAALTGETQTDKSRKVYLTFDDGPSENTLPILEILEAYGVKATFFVTGQEADSHPERYQAIVDGGHTLGMHSYSHQYKEIYSSLDDFGSDLSRLQDYIETTTGITPQFYRFPGGSSNTVSREPMELYCDYLTDNGITYFDWNVSSMDASNPMRAPEEILANCTEQLERYENAVILMHDASNKTSTVEALPGIIETILAMEDTEILPITEDTVVIHH